METEEKSEESGSALRAKVEAANAENKALRELYAGTFKHVKADDLAGVVPAEFATKAAEIETARLAERDAIAKEVLAERGLPVEDLDTVLQTLNQPQAGGADDGAAARIASLGQLGGTVPNLTPTNVFGADRIAAALAAE